MREAGVGIADGRGAAAVRSTADVDLGLEEVYDQYAGSLFRYALALVGSAEDAEEAVQEVFARLSRERGRMRGVESIKAYLFRATRNAAYSILRGRCRREDLHRSLCADVEGTDEIARSIESMAICQAFAGLPVEQREVLVLKVYDELTFQEIAEAVGVPIGTVASRYRYGIARLRQALEDKSDG